jgi:cytochrome c553
MRVALLVVVLGMFGCSGKRNVREWRPTDHDQPEDEAQVEGGDQPQAPQRVQDPEQAEQPAQPAADGQAPQALAPLVEEDMAEADRNWRHLCQRCHGRDGSGRTSMAQRIPVADLRESELTEEQIARLLVKGRREMPSFAADLGGTEMRALAKKVVAFRGGGQ